jgi:hypothetical protein
MVRVRAMSMIGVPGPETEVQVRAVGQADAPAPPAQLRIADAPDGNIEVSWVAGSAAQDVAGYRLRYAVEPQIGFLYGYTGIYDWDAMTPLGGLLTTSPVLFRRGTAMPLGGTARARASARGTLSPAPFAGRAGAAASASGDLDRAASVPTARIPYGTYVFALKAEDTAGRLSREAAWVVNCEVDAVMSPTAKFGGPTVNLVANSELDGPLTSTRAVPWHLLQYDTVNNLTMTVRPTPPELRKRAHRGGVLIDRPAHGAVASYVDLYPLRNQTLSGGYALNSELSALWPVKPGEVIEYSFDVACKGLGAVMDWLMFNANGDTVLNTVNAGVLVDAEGKHGGPDESGWRRAGQMVNVPATAAWARPHITITDSEAGGWFAIAAEMVSNNGLCNTVVEDISGTMVLKHHAYARTARPLLMGDRIVASSIGAGQLAPGAATETAQATFGLTALNHRTSVASPDIESHYTLLATVTYTAPENGTIVVTASSRGEHTMSAGTGTQQALVWDGTVDGSSNIVPLVRCGGGTGALITFAGDKSLTAIAGKTYTFKLLARSLGSAGSTVSLNNMLDGQLKIEMLKR